MHLKTSEHSFGFSIFSMILSVLSIVPTFLRPVSSYYQGGMYASNPIAAEYHFAGASMAAACMIVCLIGGIFAIWAVLKRRSTIEWAAVAVFGIGLLAQFERLVNYWVLRSSYDFIIWKC
jgi:hypothetical protein